MTARVPIYGGTCRNKRGTSDSENNNQQPKNKTKRRPIMAKPVIKYKSFMGVDPRTDQPMLRVMICDRVVRHTEEMADAPVYVRADRGDAPDIALKNREKAAGELYPHRFATVEIFMSSRFSSSRARS